MVVESLNKKFFLSIQKIYKYLTVSKSFGALVKTSGTTPAVANSAGTSAA